MVKKIVWENPNKMKFESAHKTFNKQTNLITTGNHIGDTQLSFYIRPYNEKTNPVGEPVEKGAMQNFDLQAFRDMPYHIREYVKSVSKNKSVIVNEFRHHVGEKKIVDGYVITTSAPTHELIKKFYVNDDWRAMDAVDEATKYVANTDEKTIQKLKAKHLADIL